MSDRPDVIGSHNAGKKQAYRLRRHQANSAIQDSELRRAVFTRDKSACVDCGSRESLELWHVKPVVYGGKTAPDNLVTLCKTCRLHKSLN